MITDIEQQLCFIDSETRRIPDATIDDVTKVGGYRYARQAMATIWSAAIGSEEAWAVETDEDARAPIRWAQMPGEVYRFHERVMDGDAWYGAWNAAFDRLIWNSPQSDFPPTKPEHWIDVMAQAAASNLPGKLAHAAKFVGCTQKLETGNKLIGLFEPPNGATPASRPDDWEEFVEYACLDVEAMRDVYLATRPLGLSEWEAYWASERINDRGVPVDLHTCARAAILNDEAVYVMNERIREVTGGRVDKVTGVYKLKAWLLDEIADGNVLKMLTEKRELLHEDGSLKRAAKYSTERARLEQAVAYYDSWDDLTEIESDLREVMELRIHGGSTTPAKFRTILNLADDDGNLKGQYVTNGAGQTGRFSSRGVQTHNLTRSHLGELEEEALIYLGDLDDPRCDTLTRRD